MAKGIRSRRNSTIVLAAAAATAGMISASRLSHAATLTWTGQSPSSDNWSETSNWGGPTPSAGDALTFGGTARLTPYNDAFAGVSFNSITFNPGAGAFVLGGQGVVLGTPTDGGGGNQVGGSVTNNEGAGVAQTVDINLTFARGRHDISTTAGSGNLLFGTVTAPLNINRNLGAIVVFNPAGGVINVNHSDLNNDGSDGTGILGAWATIGDNWATRDPGGNIVAYTGYTDIATGNIANVGSNNVRYIGAGGNITVPAGITTINTLLYADTGTTSGRTLTLNGTLKLGGGGNNSGGIFHASGASGPLTISGTGALTVSNGGELTLSSGPFNTSTAVNGIVNTAPITNDGINTVSVNSVGYVQSNVLSSFTGGLIITQGRFSSNQTTGFGAASNVVTVLPGAQAFFNNGNTNAQPLVISGIGPTETSGGQNLGAVRMNTNNTVLSGLITLAGDARISGGAGGANTLSGRITGPYRLELTAALGSPVSVTLSNSTNDWTGGLLLTASSAHNIPVVLGNSNVIPDGPGAGNVTLQASGNGIASLNINGRNETINGLIANGGTGTVVTNSAGAATLTVGNDNSSFTFGGALTGNLSIEKTGGGTMTINSPSGISTHTGTTTVSQGTLQLNPSSGQNPISTSNIVVNSPGTLDVASIGGAGFTLGTQTLTNNNTVSGKVTAAASSTVKGTGTFSNLLTLGGSGPTGTFSGILSPGNGIGTINLGGGLTVSGNGQLSAEFDGATADSVNVTGTANVSGLALNLSTINSHPPTLSSYTLLTATTLTGIPTLNNTMIGRQTVSLNMAALASNMIVVNLAGAAGTIRWDNSLSGTGNGTTWDNTLGGTSQNWVNPATGGSPVADSFFPNDNVVFNDTNNGKYAVNVAAAVAPGSISVTNGSGNYVFSGAGSIVGGATLTKGGNSALTISTSGNSYSGGTILNAGTLNLGSPNTSTAPSLGTGALTIGNNTTINNVVGAAATLANDIAQTWAGNFTFTGTNSLNLGAGTVTLNANPTITVSNNTLTVGGVVSDGSGNTITKAGTGTLALNGANGFTGGLVVNAGTVRFGNASAAGSGNITVNPNTTLVSFGTMNNTVSLAGGTIAGTTGSITNFTADVTVSANSGVFIQDPAVATSPVDAVEFQINGNLQGSGNINLTTGPDDAPDTGNGFRLRGTGTTNYSGILIVNNNIKAELQTATPGAYSPLGTGKIRLAAGAASFGGLLTTGATHLTDGYSELNLRNNAGADATFGNDLEITGSGLAVINTLGNAGGQTIMGNLKTGANQEVGIYLAAGGNEHTLVFPTVTITGNATFSPKINNFGAANSVGSDMALGPISESGAGGYSVTMNGLRTLQLNGANSFTGGFVINSGVVQLGDAGALNSVTPQSVTFGANVPTGTTLRLNGNSVTVPALQTNATPGSAIVEAGANTATLTVNSATPSTFVGVLQDGGNPLNLVKTGASTFVLGSDNTYTGTTTVSNGTLQVGNGGAAGSLGSGAVSVASTLAYSRSDSFTYSGAITGAGALAQNGAGSTLTLTGANTIATTTVNAGALVVANPGSLTSTVSLASGGVLGGDGTVSTVNLSAGSIHPGASAVDGVVGALPITTLNTTGGDLRFDFTSPDSAPGANNGVHDVINVTNATFGGGTATTISPFFTGGIPTAGDYTLIVSANPMSHPTNPTINLSGSRLTPTLQFLSGNTILNLNITGSGADKTWVGNINSNWNVNATPNWSLGGGDNLFFNLDSVTFDDSTANHSVILSQNVTPNRIVSNTGSSYTIDTNGFAITGGNTALLVQAGSLVLKNTGAAATNTFGGPIGIGSGATLELQTGGTIGSGAISGTSGSLKINRSGALTVGNTISGTVNLAVDGGGDVTLSGANAISAGNLTVGNGALRANSASALPAIINNVTLGTGASSGTLDLKGLNLNSVKNLDTSGSGTANTIVNSSATATSTINFIGDTTPSTFNGVINAGAGGRSVNLNMTGGSLTIAGGTMNTSSGSTVVMGGGTLTIGANSSLFSGDLTLGVRDPGGANTGSVGNLTLNNNSTVATLSIPSNTATANTINIASGKTLNVAGRSTIGSSPVAAQGGLNTVVNFTGGGNLNLTNATNAGFYVGISNMPNAGSAATDRNLARVDMTGLNSFTYSTGATGTGSMGVGWGVRPDAQLRLASGTNLIQASTLHIGDSSITPGLANLGTGDNSGGTSVLFLGTGSNNLYTGSIILGMNKASGRLDWQSTSGSVTLRGQDGTATSRTDITVGNFTGGSSTTVLSSFLLAGHNVDGKVGTLQVGRLGGATGSAVNNLMTFDTGTLDVNNMQIGVNVSGASATNGADGIFTLGNTSSTSTGTLIVNTQFALGLDTNTAAAPTKARFNVLGGTANINANIAVTANDTDGGNVFLVNLDGGTLNLMNHAIGDATRSVTLTAASGTLKNVTQINNGGGLTKSTTGTLTLDGTNTYTGTTTVSAGTLQYATSHLTGSALNVSDGARAYLPHSATTPNLVVVKTASISTNSTGHVDIGDNKLIVTGVGATGSWNGTNYTGVTGQIASGKGTGNLWDGTAGIITSQSAAVGSNLNSIGVAKASDVRPSTATATGLWGGQTITGTDTLVMYTYGGDATLDGKINIDDYVKIDSGIASGLTGWSNGDFNYDGKVNIDDYTTVIDANIGNQSGNFPAGSGIAGADGSSGVTAVPEPAGLMIVSLAASALLGRRRRRIN